MEDDYATIIKDSKKGIEDSVKSFMSKYYSRGPGLAKVFMNNDCVTIYCKDFLTSLEMNLLEDKDGEALIRMFREKIIYNNETEFINIVNSNIETGTNKFYIDFNIKDNSLACVFILNN